LRNHGGEEPHLRRVPFDTGEAGPGRRQRTLHRDLRLWPLRNGRACHLGSQTIGLLQTGQVMRRRPTEAAYGRAVEKARELGVDINTTEAREAYFATPVAPQKRLDSAASLLSIFADHLSMKSNQIAVQTANAEPPVITKAKQYIREHHTEELSLGRVAAVVHTSVFYFCKLFRKVTGTTFTEFVSRTRIEKAKISCSIQTCASARLPMKLGSLVTQ